MKIISLKVLLYIALLLILNATVFADNKPGHGRSRGALKSQRSSSHSVDKRKSTYHQARQPYYTPPFHSTRHSQEYYRPGHRTRYLPRGFNRVFLGNTEYFFFDGYFYRPFRNGFHIVDAPIGAIVLSLPQLHFNLQWNGIDFFLAGNTHYRRHHNGYIVVRNPGFRDRGR